MKILLSAYACEPNKGSEPGVGWHWALELSKLGHEVWVITRSNNKPSIDNEFSKLTKPKNLHFIFYDLPSWIRHFKKGKRFVHLYYLIWQWGAYRKSKSVHKDLKFNLVHHVTFVSIRQPSFMGNLGIPFIFGPVAGGESAPWRLRFHFGIKGFVLDAIRDLANFCVRLDPLMWMTFHQAQKIYVTSELTKKLVPRRFHHKTDIQLAIGIDLIANDNLPQRSTHIGSRILYVGQFIYWKGMGLGIRAFAKYLHKDPEARLTMVGRGPDEKRFRQLANKLDISDKIDWAHWVERKKLPEIYSQHDIFLFPSLHDSGGMVILEAMANGLPVICLNSGGPNILVNESCGIKVYTSKRNKNEISEELSVALTKLHKDNFLLKSLSSGAIHRGMNFSWQNMAKKIYSNTSCITP